MTGQKTSSSGTQFERQRLGARLRDARKYLGFNQEEVANALGIQRTALSDIEAGHRKVEAIELQQLAKLYQQTVGHFLDDKDAAAALPADVAHLARQVADLSQRDREELSQFADYLRIRSRTNED